MTIGTADMADLVVTPANVLASANKTSELTGTAGAAVSAGDLVYLDPADGLLKPADANGVANARNVRGIALNSASAGQPLAICTEDPDLAPGAAVTEGAVYVLSANPGKIAPVSDLASGHTAVIVGIGLAGNKLNFKPLKGGSLA